MTQTQLMSRNKLFKMVKFRWPIVITRNPKIIHTTKCFHCAKPFFVTVSNMRAVNFCSVCQ